METKRKEKGGEDMQDTISGENKRAGSNDVRQLNVGKMIGAIFDEQRP